MAFCIKEPMCTFTGHFVAHTSNPVHSGLGSLLDHLVQNLILNTTVKHLYYKCNQSQHFVFSEVCITLHMFGVQMLTEHTVTHKHTTLRTSLLFQKVTSDGWVARNKVPHICSESLSQQDVRLWWLKTLTQLVLAEDTTCTHQNTLLLSLIISSSVSWWRNATKRFIYSSSSWMMGQLKWVPYAF